MCVVRFALDPGNVLGDGCWESVKRAFAIMSTLWMGCILAVTSFYFAEIFGALWGGAWSDVGDIISDMAETVLWTVLLAPFYVFFSIWGFLLLPLFGLVMFYMLRADKDVTWLWFATVAITGTVAMRGMTGDSASYGSEVVAWVLYALAIVALAAGCLLLKGWEKNAQARHLQEVSAENELRRIEIEQTYGTKTFGQGNVTNDEQE